MNYLKSKFFFLIFFIYLTPINAQFTALHFELHGQISGGDCKMIYLGYFDIVERKSINDSAYIENNKFYFKGFINEPTVAFISLSKGEAFGLNATNIFLEPSSMNVRLIFDNFDDTHLDGSKTQAEYDKIESERKAIWKNHISLYNKLKEASPVERVSIEKLLLPVYDSLNKAHYKYFSENPTSYLTGYLLQYHKRNLSNDSLAMFYNRLGDDIKKYPFVESVYEKIKSKELGTVGSIAPKFFTKDTSDNDFYSGFIKGKYVLLDFWASWCVPCRQNSPHLIELYKKYKDKGLKVVGIADDRDLTKWKDAIKKDSTFLWTQVLRGANPELKMKGLKDVGDINDKFGVHVLPTYILIDPYGVIIGRYGEDLAELDKLLSIVFK